MAGAAASTEVPDHTYQPSAQATEGEVDNSVAEMRATVTITPTALFAPTPLSDMPSDVRVIPPTPFPRSNSARWLAQQSGRSSFPEPRSYNASAPVMLFWYDPSTGQNLEIGYLVGAFDATAQFELVSRPGVMALEVPYHIDQDYGLTAISPVVKERMRAAEDGEVVQGYVILDDSVAPSDPAATAVSLRSMLPAFSALSRRLDVASACERNGFEQSLS